MLRKRQPALRLGVALAVGVSGLAGGMDASPEWPAKLPEYQVKAAFLFNFARFVEWPSDAFAISIQVWAISSNCGRRIGSSVCCARLRQAWAARWSDSACYRFGSAIGSPAMLVSLCAGNARPCIPVPAANRACAKIPRGRAGAAIGQAPARRARGKFRHATSAYRGTPRPASRCGICLIVITLAVTFSPSTPSPRVAPRTRRPSS